jgi:hypothetical protein
MSGDWGANSKLVARCFSPPRTLMRKLLVLFLGVARGHGFGIFDTSLNLVLRNLRFENRKEVSE